MVVACEGGPDAAPTLRAGKGTTKGELSQVHGASNPAQGPSRYHGGPRAVCWADMGDDHLQSVHCDGHVYPRALDNDGTPTELPDAYHTITDVLPHLRPSIHTHFPSAIACPALPEEAEVDDEMPGKIGIKLGIGLEEGEPAQASAMVVSKKRHTPEKGFMRLRVVEEEEDSEEGEEEVAMEVPQPRAQCKAMASTSSLFLTNPESHPVLCMFVPLRPRV